MLIRLEMIAAIKTGDNDYTLYFLEKFEKTLLPITITAQEYEKVHEFKNKTTQAIPSLYNSLKRILLAVDCKVTSIIIYKYQQNRYYTYLSLVSNKNNLEVNCGFVDALVMSFEFNTEIYIKDEILATQGIRIDSKMLREALENGYEA